MDHQANLFGNPHPSFAPNDPMGRADRIGVVDVGSNSVRLVIYEGHCRAPQVVFNEKVMCGLGSQLSETGKLDPEGKTRALEALRRFAAIAEGLHVGALRGVATAAIRDAEDGPAFARRLTAETGIPVMVASGRDEARLAGQGVLFGNPRAEGVVLDLGGASLEFARLRSGQVIEGATTPLGPLLLARKYRNASDMREGIAAEMGADFDRFVVEGGRLYLVGGSWRALARTAMVRLGYPVEVIHEYTLTTDEIAEVAAWMKRAAPEEIAEIPGVSSNRAPHLPIASLVLSEVITRLKPKDVMVSAFGLREGVCLENLPEKLRFEDPLIAACEDQEMRRARTPGFGMELAAWAEKILPPRDLADARLLKAAALLSDVAWRTHPDYRAQGCWETVTRTTLTDIGHAGRMWLGIALVSRYRAQGKRKVAQMEEARLLSAEEIDRATQTGAVLRLGGTLAGQVPGILGDIDARVEKGRLTVTLPAELAGFAGEEVEKRLQQTGRALGLETLLERPAHAP